MGADVSTQANIKRLAGANASIVPVGTNGSTDAKVMIRPKLQTSMSMDLAQGKTTTGTFADYSCYPDRFSGDASPASATAAALDMPTIRVLGASDMHLASSAGAASASVPKMSKYNFRIRSLSVSDGEGCGSSTPSTESMCLDEAQPPTEPRRRSNSLGGGSKLYYFDFSLLPEKDPRCATDELNKRKVFQRHRLTSVGEEQMPVSADDDSASALSAGGDARSGPRKRKISSSQKYSFFDFSMIPDKMEVCEPSPSADGRMDISK